MMLKPVGRVRSALRDKTSAPHQGRGREIRAVIELDPGFEAAAREIEAGAKIWLLTWLHLADREILRTHPKGNTTRPRRGVFFLRSSVRPNPIGLHLVEVVKVEGCRIEVDSLEALDGTPVLDIKPYVPGIDA
jgi:tRNA-Thr(GGU) m(6)t(6)A37 methyltransferase TsaA